MKKKLFAVVFSLTLLVGVLIPSSDVCAASLVNAGCICYKGAGTHQVVVVKPSCEVNGVGWDLCNNCGYIIRTFSISKLGHTYSYKGLWHWCDRCGH